MLRKFLAVAIGVFLCSALAARFSAWTDRAQAHSQGQEPGDDTRRAEMIREIEADVIATRGYTGRSQLDPRVMQALREVPRHEFVPARLRHRAYENRPLPIGDGQTISQPYIVALMTDLLEIEDEDVVLEIGTGSGYQAAVLAELAGQVFSIEIIESLGRKAATLLEELGYDNVETRIGDGYLGWPEEAPFDGIIVTAAAPEIPPPLIEQLRPGGRMVIPAVRGPSEEQLMIVTKTASGEIRSREILPVRFVPLTGDR